MRLILTTLVLLSQSAITAAQALPIQGGAQSAPSPQSSNALQPASPQNLQSSPTSNTNLDQPTPNNLQSAGTRDQLGAYLAGEFETTGAPSTETATNANSAIYFWLTMAVAGIGLAWLLIERIIIG